MATPARPEHARRRGFCFAPPGADLLLSFAGSRWKLWNEKDVAVGVSHVDPQESYTVACWGPTSSSASSSSLRTDGFVALGCASGRIQFWDARAGEPLGPVSEAFRGISSGVDAGVTALTSAQVNRASVFAGCAAVPDVLEVGIYDGVCRSRFKAGKAMGIAQLAASVTGPEWLLSASAGGAALKLWNIGELVASPAPQAHRRLVGPARSALAVDLRATDTCAMALCCDGGLQVDVFISHSGASGGGDEAARPPLAAALALSSREPVQTARFYGEAAREGAPQSRAGVIGYGTSAVMIWTFKSSGKGGTRTVAPIAIVTAEELGGRVLSARPDTFTPASAVVAFGPAAQVSLADVKAPVARGGESTFEVRLPIRSQTAPPAAAKPTHSAQPSAPEGATPDAATLPEVLGPLQVAAARSRPQKRAAGEGLAPPAKKVAALPDAKHTSSAISVAPLVRQAIQSKDTGLMEQVFKSSGSNRVIISTVAALSGAEAFDMLQTCTRRLLKEPANARGYGFWVKEILIQHCAFIQSQPVLRTALEPLHDLLEMRTSSYMPLVRLRGRLQMLQGMSAAAIDSIAHERDTLRTPLTEYVEGDEEVGEDASTEAETAGAKGPDDEDGEDDDSDDIFDDDIFSD